MKSTRTTKRTTQLHHLLPFFLILAVSAILFDGTEANAQCTELSPAFRRWYGAIYRPL